MSDGDRSGAEDGPPEVVDGEALTGVDDPVAESVMDEEETEPSDLAEGLADSEGSPLVLFGLNLLLSSLFASTLVAAMSFVGLLEYSPINVALTAAFFVVVTAVVLR